MAAFWLLVTEGGADLVDAYDVAGWQKSTFKEKVPCTIRVFLMYPGTFLCAADLYTIRSL